MITRRRHPGKNRKCWAVIIKTYVSPGTLQTCTSLVRKQPKETSAQDIVAYCLRPWLYLVIFFLFFFFLLLVPILQIYFAMNIICIILVYCHSVLLMCNITEVENQMYNHLEFFLKFFICHKLIFLCINVFKKVSQFDLNWKYQLHVCSFCLVVPQCLLL